MSPQEHIDTSTAAGQLVFHILAALAEFERNVIRERVEAGLQAARAKGRTGGRQRIDGAKLEQAVKLMAANTLSIKEIGALVGIRRTTLYHYLNLDGSCRTW